MGIKLSDLPPELRRHVLEVSGLKPAPAVPRSPKARKASSGLMRVCSCLFEIFRPDGSYPERCDGCGTKWPD
jgi:hypothetical protein